MTRGELELGLAVNMGSIKAREMLAMAQAANLDAATADRLMVVAGVPKRQIAQARTEMLKEQARNTAKGSNGRWQ